MQTMGQLIQTFKTILKGKRLPIAEPIPGFSEKKQTSESDKDLALIMNYTEEPFVFVDASFSIVLFNEKFRSAFAYYFDRNVCKRDSILEYAPTERLSATKSLYQKVFAGEQAQADIEIVLSDHSHVHFCARYKPVSDARGKVTGAFVTITDTTIRKKSEEMLILKERQFRTLVENSADVTVILSVDEKISYISPSVKRILGYTEEAILEVKMQDLIHSDDETTMQCILAESMGMPAASVQGYKLRMAHKNGKWHRFEVIATNMLHDASINGIIYNLRDVTEKELAEEQKEFEQRNKEALINSTQDLIWSVDTDLNLIAGNHAFIQSLMESTGINFKPGDTLLREDVFPKEPIWLWGRLYRRALAGESFTHEFFTYESDKTGASWLEVHFHPIYNSDETVAGFACYGRDVTMQRKATKQLNESEEKFRTLIERVSDAFISLDKDLCYTYVNNKAAELVHRSPESLIGKYVWDVFPDSIGTLAYDAFKTAMDTQQYIHYTDYNASLNLWQENHLYPSRDGLSVFIRDISERKFAEEKIKLTENYLKIIFENSSEGFFLLDKNCIVKAFNPRAKEYSLLSAPKELQLGESFYEYIEPSRVEYVREFISRALNGATLQYDRVFNYDNGDVRWFNVTLNPVQETNGINGICITIKDITRRKISEEIVLKEKELSDRIINTLPGIFYMFDDTGKFLRWNKNFENVSEYSSNEIKIMTPDMFYQGADKELIKERIGKVFSEGEADAEAHLVTKTGKKIPYYFTGILLSYEGKRCLIGAGIDITERKQSEQLLLKYNAQLCSAQQIAQIGYWEHDVINNSTYWSDEMYRICGLNKGDVHDKDTFLSFIHPEDMPLFMQNHMLSIKNKEPANIEFRIIRKDGTVRHVLGKNGFISKDDMQLNYIEGTLQDITGQKENEQLLLKLNVQIQKRAEELAISNTELEQFAYVASHDLQEPLRMVTSFLTQLQKKYKDQLDDKAQQYIHFATDGAIRMRKIILDLLEYSRIGRKEYLPEKIDINEMMEQIVHIYRTEIHEKEATVQWANLPVIYAGRTPIQQVFQNLISNALKYQTSHKKPLIKVGAIETSTHWQFSIADNGIGIDPRFYDKIFVLFQRLHNKDEFSGTGIGLAISKKIVESYKGSIWLDSTIDKGSTFYFTIAKER